MRWERWRLSADPTVQNSGPGKRWGHTCNAVRGGKLLYVFGGYGKDNCQTNQVHVFDTVTQKWSEPVMKGTPPSPRDSHSCTTVGDNLFTFGGTDGLNPLKDLHILDTFTNTWVSPTLRGEGPEAREGHSAALVGRRLFIFGGCGKNLNNSDEKYYNDLYILNTETYVWKRANTSGTPPSPRDSHTCSSWKNKVVVIGGEDEHDYYLSDVHILDADALVWTELTNLRMPPRAGHTAVAFGKNLFVFGGFTDAQNLYDDLNILNIETGVWTKLMTAGEGPSARFSMAGDSLDPQRGGVIVFIGGCNKTLEALDDMYFLYTGLVREDEGRLENLSLRKQLKKRCQEQLFPSPLQGSSDPNAGANTYLYQPVPLQTYGQASTPVNQSQPIQGKRIFQAKVIERFQDGYTIETSIDGKPLRGIIFSNKPSGFSSPYDNSNRKRASVEVSSVKLNDDQAPNTKAARSHGRDEVDHREKDGILGKDPTLQDDSHKEVGDVKPLVAAIVDLEDNGRHEVSNCGTKVSDENPSPTSQDVAKSSPKQANERALTIEEHSQPVENHSANLS